MTLWMRLLTTCPAWVGLALWCGLWATPTAATDQGAPLKRQASRATSRTLAECFLAIPDDLLPEPARARRRALLRPEHVVVRDERNGYLQIAGDGARPTVTVAKFRRTDGTYLIAFTADYEMVSTCHLLEERQGGQLVEVSAALIPDYRICGDFESADCQVYELPRYGTTIVVKDGQGRVRYRLAWRGNRFERSP
ncbi:hypothetical protein J8C06_07860 [Chloracidobacterium validum]|uniref:Uncharacterized protein n=1 Tax=Chloracidobacterium validum TaxID=2821543 RepID=A0ABX8B5N0_9BACT|nr:hypothetical protein [Chloracidobacterium validum]QUW02273.1 hypothetical protein J8C06_07860 [Chloracidobacterium validum]